MDSRNIGVIYVDLWVLPTAFSDPDGAWNNEANAYDDNTVTYANTSSDSHELIFTLDPVSCDKIRYYVSTIFISLTITISVYYSDAWHEIFNGIATEDEYVEVQIGSTETVTQGKISVISSPSGRGGNVHEFQFRDPTGNFNPWHCRLVEE